MTLNGALCDDLTALEACVLRPLPHLDISGRQLLFLEPSRHTREGYTSESMVRRVVLSTRPSMCTATSFVFAYFCTAHLTQFAITFLLQLRAVWYVIEVTAQTNIDAQGGFVIVNWAKDLTMWEYDHKLYDEIVLFDRTSWPVKILANHVCCPPWIVVNVIQPLLNAVFHKRLRDRNLQHDVPESQILDVLSSYGIMKDMLPLEMGGTIVLDQSEWIANRRAAEIEQI